MRTLLLAAAVWAVASQGVAETSSCGLRKSVAMKLMRAGQVQVGQNVAEDGRRMAELFANLKTGQWTLLATTPDGRSCIGHTGWGVHKLFASLAAVRAA